MEFIFAVVALTAAYFLVKKIRGPLPPKKEPTGGQPGEENPTGPVAEE